MIRYFLYLCLIWVQPGIAQDWPPDDLGGYWLVTGTSEEDVQQSTDCLILFVDDLFVFVQPNTHRSTELVEDPKSKTFVERLVVDPPEVWAATLEEARRNRTGYEALSKKQMRERISSETVRFQIELKELKQGKRREIRITFAISDPASLTSDGWLTAIRADQENARGKLKNLLSGPRLEITQRLREDLIRRTKD